MFIQSHILTYKEKRTEDFFSFIFQNKKYHPLDRLLTLKNKPWYTKNNGKNNENNFFLKKCLPESAIACSNQLFLFPVGKILLLPL